MLQIVERPVVVPERAKNGTCSTVFMRPHGGLNTFWPIGLEEYLRLWANAQFAVPLVFHHNFTKVAQFGLGMAAYSRR